MLPRDLGSGIGNKRYAYRHAEGGWGHVSTHGVEFSPCESIRVSRRPLRGRDWTSWDGWVVMHVPSGLRFVKCATKAVAMEAAQTIYQSRVPGQWALIDDISRPHIQAQIFGIVARYSVGEEGHVFRETML